MPDAEQIRERQRATWDGLSAGWEAWGEVIADQLRPVAEAIIAPLGTAAGRRHLDVASGTGEPGLTIARRAPGARVVLTDLSPAMLDVARRRARALGLHNVATVVCSADRLPLPDASVDGVSVRFGHMFFPDPAAATAELARVLRPGGRLCSSVWAGPGENPWTTITMRAIAAETDVPTPGPDDPGMFRCAAPGHVTALYERAGLTDVVETDVGVELVTTSPEQYWQVMSEHVSPAVAALARVDDAARERIRAAVLHAVSRWERDGAVRVPGLARCVVGTR